MKNLFGYKYIAYTSAGLVLLLFFAVLIGSVMQRNDPDVAISGTPAPTRFNSSKGGFEGEPLPTLADDDAAPNKKERIFTADQLERYKKFDRDVPYYSQDFDIDYSKLLDQYFVALKTEQAEAAFDAYLKERMMLDIRNQYRDMFVLGEDPAYDQIRKAEENYLQSQTQ